MSHYPRGGFALGCPPQHAGSVRAPSPAYRRMRSAYRHGRYDEVHATGDDVAVALSADPDQRELVPAAVLMHGSALAELGNLTDACRYLSQGLDMVDGTRSERELGGADWYALRLLELLVQRGRYDEALRWASSLEVPDRRPETRLGAIRARIAVLTARAEDDAAWLLLNAATSVVQRVRSNLQSSLVQGDRALLLARSGRLDEGVRLADEVLDSMGRPGEGRQLAWAAADAAALGLTLARLTAEAGDLATAERFLEVGADGAGRAGGMFLSAHVLLARASVWRVAGLIPDAEAVCRDALQSFTVLGCAPSAAQCRYEEARLAWDRGMANAALPLFQHALAEFTELGHRREMVEIRGLLDRSVDSGPHPGPVGGDTRPTERTTDDWAPPESRPGP